VTAQVEQSLIERAACFQIIYDHHLADLSRYPILVLAGCVALSETQISAITAYVENGGRLGIVGPLATQDEWVRSRSAPAFASLPADRVVRCQTSAEIFDAVRQTWPDRLTLTIDNPVGLCCEVTDLPGRRLVHLVNYRPDDPVRNVRVQMRVPGAVRGVTLTGPGEDTEIALPFDQVDDTVSFTVPEVAIYRIAVATFG